MRNLRVICAFLLALSCSLPAFSQAVSATLLGTVTDSSGAVVANSKITVTEITTGVNHAAQTNESGNYTLPNVPPGRYEVTVESAGFKKETRKDILVQVDSTTRVDVQLQPGNVTETVEVTGAPPQLQTDSASTSQKIDSTAGGTGTAGQQPEFPEPSESGARRRARHVPAFAVFQCLQFAPDRSQRPDARGQQLHDRGY